MKLSLNPKDWNAYNGTPMHRRLLGGWVLKIPNDPDSVNYIYTRVNSLSNNIHFKFLVKAFSPQYKHYAQGNIPPSFRLWFQQKNDDWRSDGYRWWNVGLGVFVLPNEGNSTSILYATNAPSTWQGLYGKLASSSVAYTERFNEAWNNVENFGITFGVDNSFGHGVALTKGKVKVVCLDAEV